MKKYRLNGKPRGNRKYSDYQNSSLPTIEGKLFFILHYLKTNNLQSVQGTLWDEPAQGLGQYTGFQGFTLENVAILQPQKTQRQISV